MNLREIHTTMFDRYAKLALIVACLTLAGSAMGFQWAVSYLNVYLKKQPVELRSMFNTIPDFIGDWKKAGDDGIMEAAMVESLGTNKYLERYYVLQNSKGGPTVLRVHLAYYTGMIDAVPHVPDRCMVAGGFNPKALPENIPLHVDTSRWPDDPLHRHSRENKPYPMVEFPHYFTGQMTTVRMPLGDFELRTTEFNSEERPDRRVFAGYFFIANGYTTPTPDAVRLLAFRASEKYAYYCKVQFNMEGPLSFTREQFVGVVSGFVSDFLPELMRCLPDWAEIESQSQVEFAQAPPAPAQVLKR